MRKTTVLDVIDFIALTIFGCLSLGYILWMSDFAEWHIAIKSLDFPVFIGEIVMFLGVMLGAIKWLSLRPRLGKVHYAAAAYFAFVLWKAAAGYAVYGPLALRHAALFYYPLFAVFGKVFFSARLVKRFRLFLLILICLIFLFLEFSIYWLMTLAILALVLCLSFPAGPWRFVLTAGLLMAVPYRYFFNTARMMMLANLLTGIYLTVGSSLLWRMRKGVKMIVWVGLLAVMATGFIFMGDKNAVKSMVQIEELIREYQALDQRVQGQYDDFVMRDLKVVNVYNRNKASVPAAPDDAGVAAIPSDTTRQDPTAQSAFGGPGAPGERVSSESDIAKESENAAPVEQGVAADIAKKPENAAGGTADGGGEPPPMPGPAARNIETARANVLFRIFIWRDMLVELAEHRPVMGFSFGKPFRSKSLEILEWAIIEWLRDGWVSEHNSFLHMIYRGGIMGMALILFYLGVVFKMIRRAVAVKSLQGVLLCGILINWFIAANFMPILELPYTAVPIWLLFGIIYAYVFGLNDPGGHRAAVKDETS